MDGTLRPHQARILQQNPKKALLAWEMRTGKTLPAKYWVSMPERSQNAYIITPKANKKDWGGTPATVLTKEEFKKATIENPTAIVVDEAHYFASPLFLPKRRSILATALYTLLKKYPDCHVLLLTATPIKNDAWSLHTLLCFIGIYYDWKEWRKGFFVKEYMPFLERPVWMKPGEVPTAWVSRPDWRKRIAPYLQQHADIVTLKDCVGFLPEPTHEVITIKQSKYEKPEDEQVNWMHEHKHEQQGKEKSILALGYKKLIVVVHYTDQIDELAKVLSEEKRVFILDGRTKDPDAVKRAAQEADECYFIVQASMGFGFDGYMFGAIVFASMSHKYVDYKQMLGRSTSVDHVRPVTYLYLIGGRWDRRIYETVKSGETFYPGNYAD